MKLHSSVIPLSLDPFLKHLQLLRFENAVADRLLIITVSEGDLMYGHTINEPESRKLARVICSRNITL